MNPSATLSSKFQISIPKRIREEMHWTSGQEFAFISKGQGTLLIPVPTLDQLVGIARGANTDSVRDHQDRF